MEENDWAIAQALRPAGSVQFAATRNWSLQATAAYSRNMGFHAYDAVQSGFAVSYAMPIPSRVQGPGWGSRTEIPDSFLGGHAAGDFL